MATFSTVIANGVGNEVDVGIGVNHPTNPLHVSSSSRKALFCLMLLSYIIFVNGTLHIYIYILNIHFFVFRFAYNIISVWFLLNIN